MFKSKLAQLMREKSAREKVSVTQQDIAGYTKIAYPTINRWYHGESMGRIDASVVVPLMDYFECQLEDLIDIER